MTVAELIAKLKKFPPELEVLDRGEGVLVHRAAWKGGTVQAIAVHTAGLRPGTHWRVPLNRNDEPNAERVTFFVL